jgi:CheY-like chemotaxis protein
MVVVEVTDTGVGMDELTRARIFEPFFTTKGEGQGTGLGLAVVYGAVTQSDGVITVESQPGAGTRFVVMLPRSAAPATKASARVARVSPGARILLVEDNDAIRAVATRVLERAGYVVTRAVDGVDALGVIAARERDFDLVLTDLNMPRMDGFELAGRLSSVMPATRLLFMTGFSEELAEVSRHSPATACLVKPFTPDQLLDRVGEALLGPTVEA